MTPPKSVEAALGKYSKLDSVDNWLIERKIDAVNSEITCRASVPGYYSWFGDRVHLNNVDKIVVPSHYSDFEKPKASTISKVVRALKDCRSGLIYTPDY